METLGPSTAGVNKINVKTPVLENQKGPGDPEFGPGGCFPPPPPTATKFRGVEEEKDKTDSVRL